MTYSAGAAVSKLSAAAGAAAAAAAAAAVAFSASRRARISARRDEPVAAAAAEDTAASAASAVSAPVDGAVSAAAAPPSDSPASGSESAALAGCRAELLAAGSSEAEAVLPGPMGGSTTGVGAAASSIVSSIGPAFKPNRLAVVRYRRVACVSCYHQMSRASVKCEVRFSSVISRPRPALTPPPALRQAPRLPV